MKTCATNGHGVQTCATIVPAVPGDLAALERIESLCFGASVAISRRQFRYLLRTPGASVYVLRAGGPPGLGRSSLGEGGSTSSPPSSSLSLRAEGRAQSRGGAGQVVGDAIVLRRKGKTGVAARLYSLAVAPEHRGKGFGRSLLCHCLAEIRKEGDLDVTLEVEAENASAIALYESLGFRKARRLAGYYGPGQDGWRMKLKFV